MLTQDESTTPHRDSDKTREMGRLAASMMIRGRQVAQAIDGVIGQMPADEAIDRAQNPIVALPVQSIRALLGLVEGLTHLVQGFVNVHDLRSADKIAAAVREIVPGIDPEGHVVTMIVAALQPIDMPAVSVHEADVCVDAEGKPFYVRN